ncbi:protein TRIGALACTOSYLDIACYLGLYCEROL 4, chloroplastic isoform X2 [Neltuma alba]|uniref:LOW QUALITY PROTEIN: protein TRIGALACTOSYLDIACYLGLYCEROL 4, chloroplastic-like n=1 Tax=Neltuma alba TaxID=207710 RepID=UPI0010A440A1|nr:LOW QUALITY PROTEIN: protein TRIGALACTOSYLDIACYLGLYCEROL 4, chloroplastic-like [Prosopis alba]XP_028759254.1 protein TRIGALACTOSYLDIACYLGLYCEROL 4, chloroplastic-like isoform X2 [Prosopis alba]
MRKLRWAMDGAGFWDLDVSTPKTLDGLACPVPGDPIPLGISRGTRLSRPNQIDFIQRFMHAPLIPSYSKPQGLSLQRVLTIPFSDSWFVTLLGQFNVQRFVASVKSSGESHGSVSSWLKSLQKHLQEKSLYALNLCTDFLLTPDDTLLVGLDAYGYTNKRRIKTVLHHKFAHHDLMVEAVWPGLFVDKTGNYWDVPFSMAIDLASLATSDSAASYHLSLHRNIGTPEQFENNQNQSSGPPPTLLPGLAIKSAFSYKKKVDIWRSTARMLKLVQPYDFFLSNPHVSATGIIGVAATTSVGENSVRALVEDDRQGSRGFYLEAYGMKASCLADIFASVSFAAQYGNFQRLFLDLSRFQARLDFPSGLKFLSAATSVTQDLLNSQRPTLEAVQAICPDATFSLQQQIVGPLSFRVDSGVTVDLKNPKCPIQAQEPILAFEYALQVLGSAKAVAWYSPYRQEFMAELRFFET